MKSLILDTATKVLYCALVIDDEIKYEKYISGQNDHAKKVVDVVDEACKLNNIKPLDLDEVICGVGPGSYTGVRMAVTVAKMLASLGNIVLKSISTLCLMSSGYDGVCKARIDARRGNAFTGYYLNLDSLVDEKLVSIDDESIKYEYLATETNYIVNPIKVIKKAVVVQNPFLIIPNYLRDTEAERNVEGRN